MDPGDWVGLTNAHIPVTPHIHLHLQTLCLAFVNCQVDIDALGQEILLDHASYFLIRWMHIRLAVDHDDCRLALFQGDHRLLPNLFCEDLVRIIFEDQTPRVHNRKTVIFKACVLVRAIASDPWLIINNRPVLPDAANPIDNRRFPNVGTPHDSKQRELVALFEVLPRDLVVPLRKSRHPGVGRGAPHEQPLPLPHRSLDPLLLSSCPPKHFPTIVWIVFNTPLRIRLNLRILVPIPLLIRILHVPNLHPVLHFEVILLFLGVLMPHILFLLCRNTVLIAVLALHILLQLNGNPVLINACVFQIFRKIKLRYTLFVGPHTLILFIHLRIAHIFHCKLPLITIQLKILLLLLSHPQIVNSCDFNPFPIFLVELHKTLLTINHDRHLHLPFRSHDLVSPHHGAVLGRDCLFSLCIRTCWNS
mmetsp:Transcript_24712/g.42376  ORF Transcript_24712/g.42376 Transcript_24712/m.42376 type:complete len:419 (+) Transcript_24712:1471-2727(+)